MERQGPTTRERLVLERIAKIPERSLIVAVAVGALVLSLRALPEQYATLSSIAAVVAVLVGLTFFIYQACFLRCPRCSGWIAVPKCPSCGLKLDRPSS